MFSLVRAEVRRLTSRRLARILAALAVLVILLVEGRAFLTSSRDLDAARRRAERQVSAQRPSPRDISDICMSMQASDQIPPDVDCLGPGAAAAVSEVAQFGPSVEDVFHDPRLKAKEKLPDGARAVAVAVAILAFLVGASFIGAEWHAGTMQALLFWETRRGRVLLAKAVALVGVAIAFALALQVLVYGATYLTAATRGSTEGVTAGLHMSVLLVMLRGMVVVGICALLGFGVAGLARVTAASLGVAFVYFVILENLMRALRPGWQRFLFSENVSAILFKKFNVATATAPNIGDSFEGRTFYYSLTAVRGVVTLAVYLAILLGAFYVTFNRRDVT
jgi:ABC-type transport system involved in multi-copper enzyme maturation permease subunit